MALEWRDRLCWNVQTYKVHGKNEAQFMQLWIYGYAGQNHIWFWSTSKIWQWVRGDYLRSSVVQMHVERDVSKVSESLVMMTIQISYNEKKPWHFILVFFYLGLFAISVFKK